MSPGRGCALNFYKHHIGDYDADTSHLSWTEDAAYRRLLCLYYRREQPIPSDVAQACRLVRATSKPERDAVETVLREFFQPGPDGWRHKRCDEEIESAAKKSTANRTNGKGGGRPPKTKSEAEPNANPEETQSVSVGFIRAGGTNSQTPDSRLQDNPVAPSGAKSAQPTTRASGEGAEKATPTIPCPYAEIVDRYHARLPELPRAKLMPASRQKAMRKVWGWVLSSTKSDGTRRATTAEEALRWLDGYFVRASQNDFLMGRTPRSAEHANWRCDLDFLLTDRGMKHVIEGTTEAAA